MNEAVPVGQRKNSLSHRSIAIYGAGGFGREVAWLALSCPAINVVCFIDDSPGVAGKLIHGIPVIDLEKIVTLFPNVEVFSGIGSPRIRQITMSKSAQAGYRSGTIVHPSAHMSQWIQIDEGAVICAGSVLTTDIRIGRHVQINLNCTIGHDVVMGDYVTLSPGVHVSGYVRIGNRVFFGTGAVVINGTKDKPIEIGDDAIIGAGAVVTRSVPSGSKVVGVPAEQV